MKMLKNSIVCIKTNFIFTHERDKLTYINGNSYSNFKYIFFLSVLQCGITIIT